jgi:simple sugar transport system ATP-binding protein
MTASTNVALATLGIDLGAKVASPIGSLSGGQRQAVAVARAVHWGASLLLMDEPTAALGVEQTARVGTLIKEATTAGVGVLVVSHDLPWVQAICDKTIVLYRGRLVAVLERQASLETMVGWITGSLIPRRSVDIHASPGALGV